MKTNEFTTCPKCGTKVKINNAACIKAMELFNTRPLCDACRRNQYDRPKIRAVVVKGG